MAKHHVIDYDTFLQRLVAGLRKAWQQVRRQRPDETFYTFGIETDSDITDLYPLCNTEEEYRSQGGDSEPAVMKWVGCLDEESELYRAGREHTSVLAREVNRYVFEDHSNDPESAFMDRKKKLLRVFEKALVQLNEEGFFGAGKKRNRVLLKIEFVDPSNAEWKHMLKVIERINPPESTTAFFTALEQQEDADAARKAEKQQQDEPIRRLAIEFLRRAKRPFESCFSVRQIEPITPYLLKCIREATPPDELWEVSFNARNEPAARSHGAGVLIVYVIPESAKCVIAP
jgi:hypothetical protein